MLPTLAAQSRRVRLSLESRAVEPEVGALIAPLARSINAQVLETPLSWVLLSGDSAWKIKKKVSLPFVDYSTLEARHHYCLEEFRLNKQLAPAMYLGVVPIGGSPHLPLLDGPGPVLDYAVHMRRLSPGSLFSERLAAQTLSMSDIEDLAVLLAELHMCAPKAAVARFANPARRAGSALAALNGVRPIATPAAARKLEHWLITEAESLRPFWEKRHVDGHVRECHGDLHLGNVGSLDARITVFDRVEFSPALRWIDVLDDIAFPIMDLSAHGRDDFAYHLLNTWLEHTGDHDALTGLRFSVVYRALVRAQVEYLRGSSGLVSAGRYFNTALAWAHGGNPWLFITTGLPGSGKTFFSGQLIERDGAIRIRSDVERKRLSGLHMLDRSLANGLSIYSDSSSARTYAHLRSLAKKIMDSGFAVIVDAAFLRQADRQIFRELAVEAAVPFVIMECKASQSVLQQRLIKRRNDASEATVDTLKELALVAEPLTKTESAFSCRPPISILPSRL
ncbi:MULTISPECIES: bifunctional aminoglycoside phosphotransferase/ATP-binding protein [Polaromonas]|uniref:AAA family ATPase n=1 Tax=Polaromonas aquatica TaxID=332657 RepID=A0ABW1TTQ2_9BURK